MTEVKHTATQKLQIHVQAIQLAEMQS